MNRARTWIAAVCTAFAVSGHARASDPVLSPELRAIEVTDRRGETLDLDLAFVDHTGKAVTLREIFDGERPVILTLNYYRCRVVCSVQLNGLADGLRELSWTPGDENFDVVTVSIDPRETPADATKKRATVMSALGRGDDVGWHFLTGDELSIRALAADLGIAYAYDAEQDQYAHPGVVVFATPDGRVSRYVYGLAYAGRDLKLGLLESGEGKIGDAVDHVYLSCFSYDPSIGRYGPFAFGIMRIGGVITLFGLGIFLVILWRRERRQTREAEAT